MTMTQERQDVLDFWKKLSKPDAVMPTFQNVGLIDYLDKDSTSNCCLYMIYNGREYAFFASRERILKESNLPKSHRILHVPAMKMFLKYMNLVEQELFDFIVGFYVEKGDVKHNSCVNIIFSSTATRQLGSITQAAIENFLKNLLEPLKKDIYDKLMKK